MRDDSILQRVTAILADSSPALRTADAAFDLVDSGAIDSAGFMDLFRRLEDAFGIVVTPADLDFDHFRTPLRIAGFVRAKLNDREASTRVV
jgi:acyl carrier protein